MISTHILDTTLGCPAANVKVLLEQKIGNDWKTLGEEFTNGDGRIVFSQASSAGVYRLTFQVEKYFKDANREFFFLDTPVIFRIQDLNRKYHVPLLLNPFGFSTYRGS